MKSLVQNKKRLSNFVISVFIDFWGGFFRIFIFSILYKIVCWYISAELYLFLLLYSTIKSRKKIPKYLIFVSSKEKANLMAECPT